MDAQFIVKPNSLGRLHALAIHFDLAARYRRRGQACVLEPVRQNFIQIRPRIETADQAQLRRLEIWSELTFAELRRTFEERKQGGFIRECHGDAHLANMVWREERVLLFDCLEFSDNLRWIDVMSELAFLVMDLDDRGRPDLAHRALNAYLEHTGDYAGLALFGVAVLNLRR